jgi:hypothetical protein
MINVTPCGGRSRIKSGMTTDGHAILLYKQENKPFYAQISELHEHATLLYKQAQTRASLTPRYAMIVLRCYTDSILTQQWAYYITHTPTRQH